MTIDTTTIIYWLRILLVSLSPLLLVILKREELNDPFKPLFLFKILFLFFPYYVILTSVFKSDSLGMYGVYWGNIIARAVLSSLFIIAVAKFTDLVSLQNSLFPTHKKVYKYFFFFSLYMAAIIFLGVKNFPDKLISANIVNTAVIIRSHWLLILFSALIEFYIVFGEELVFRYFTINTLSNYFSNIPVIIISCLLWAFMHHNISFSIMILGLILGFVYIRTQNLFVCILMHFIWNIETSLSPIYVYYKSSNTVPFTPIQYTAITFILIVLFGFLLLSFHKKFIDKESKCRLS